MNTEPIVQVQELSLSYRHGNDWLQALDHVSFGIHSGEAFGLIGESGCGKSTLAYTLLGYRHASSRVDHGHVRYLQRDMLTLSRLELASLRGNRIGLVPQNPTTAFNPAMRIGAQLVEVLIQHQRTRSNAEARARVVEMFDLVGLPEPASVIQRYPHQLSGGQQQRAALAMALICEPDLVVLDEPTTGLDVTTQRQVIELLRQLRSRLGLAMLYVTHDLRLLGEIADRIGVMYAGRLVEVAPIDALYRRACHPYSRGLLASVPQIEPGALIAGQPLRGLLQRESMPKGCGFYPRCDYAEALCAEQIQCLIDTSPGHQVACRRWREIPAVELSPQTEQPCAANVTDTDALLAVEGVSLAYGAHRSRFASWLGPPPTIVVHSVSFNIARSECFALVGESGSGKSTIAKALCGLLSPLDGRISFAANTLAGKLEQRTRDTQRQLQYIFQNPDASLNPRHRVSTILMRSLRMFLDVERRLRKQRLEQALRDVRLPIDYLYRFPDQLSGGERQRVAIARALIAEPELLLCDEILSALDVSVQASILVMLKRLRSEKRVAMLFISHDLAVVRELADRVGVLYQGHLCEIGSVDEVFRPPFHPYTLSLLLAVPGRRRVAPLTTNDPIASLNVPSGGCVFAGRCAVRINGLCDNSAPPWRITETGLRIRCHLEPAALTQLQLPELPGVIE